VDKEAVGDMPRSGSETKEAAVRNRPNRVELGRVEELLAKYGAHDASAAALLCDRHDPHACAYRVIAPDMSAEDITYAELREEAERFAAALSALGVRPGQRVATLMGKSRAYLVTVTGIWRAGAVHVPLFTAFAPSAIAYRLEDSDAKVVVCDADQQEKLTSGTGGLAGAAWQTVSTGGGAAGVLAFDELMAAATPGLPAAAVGGDAPIIHIYTSGTTGSPKGVVVPMRALASFQVYAEFGLGIVPEDVFWCAADPGWAYGLYFGVLAAFTTGAKSIFLKGGFSPALTMATLERERVTNFAAAPTVYRSLRSSGVHSSTKLALRRASSAGEPLMPEVNDWAERALGVAVHDHYGQTEAGMLINNHHHPAFRRPIRAGSMGRAMPGWTAAILHNDRDEEVWPGTLGRVAMRLAESPLAWFRGYDGEPSKSAEKFTADGRWYVTGDNGLVDEEGYFHFSSRDDDVIIMAGYRIGPFEVEAAMLTHPAVVEAAVVAAPDETRGEVVEAYAVLATGVDPTPELESDIQQWVKTQYAAHAYPRAVHFVSDLPKTPSGKIQRFVLKKQRKAELEASR
jgi:acetyl-CoA synthetase